MSIVIPIPKTDNVRAENDLIYRRGVLMGQVHEADPLRMIVLDGEAKLPEKVAVRIEANMKRKGKVIVVEPEPLPGPIKPLPSPFPWI